MGNIPSFSFHFFAGTRAGIAPPSYPEKKTDHNYACTLAARLKKLAGLSPRICGGDHHTEVRA